MTIKYNRLVIKQETKEIVHKCIDKFIKDNPKLEGIRITEDFIIKRLCANYMRF